MLPVHDCCIPLSIASVLKNRNISIFNTLFCWESVKRLEIIIDSTCTRHLCYNFYTCMHLRCFYICIVWKQYIIFICKKWCRKYLADLLQWMFLLDWSQSFLCWRPLDGKTHSSSSLNKKRPTSPEKSPLFVLATNLAHRSYDQCIVEHGASGEHHLVLPQSKKIKWFIIFLSIKDNDIWVKENSQSYIYCYYTE